MAKAAAIEDQLLDEDKPTQKVVRRQGKTVKEHQQELQDQLTDFETEIMMENEGFFFNEDGTIDAMKPAVRILKGDEAQKYLGLRPTKHNILERWSLKKIEKRFKHLFAEMNQEGKDPNIEFWNNIRVQVWKRSNIGKYSGTAPIDVDAAKTPQRYNGCFYGGDAIRIYLPNVEHATRPQNYIVKLLEVHVTEEMDSYG